VHKAATNESPSKQTGDVRPRSGALEPLRVARLLWHLRPVIADVRPVTAAQFKAEAERSFEGLSLSPNTITRMARRGWIRPLRTSAGPSGRGRTTYYLRRDLVPVMGFHLLKGGGWPDREARRYMDLYVDLEDDTYAALHLSELAERLTTHWRAERELFRTYAGLTDHLGEEPASHVLRSGTLAFASVLWQVVYWDFANLDPRIAHLDLEAVERLIGLVNLAGRELQGIQERLDEPCSSIETERALRSTIGAAIADWVRTPQGDLKFTETTEGELLALLTAQESVREKDS
jgi:hypothetical protein